MRNKVGLAASVVISEVGSYVLYRMNVVNSYTRVKYYSYAPLISVRANQHVDCNPARIMHDLSTSLKISFFLIYSVQNTAHNEDC